MDYVAEITVIETRLKRAGTSVAAMLRHADVAPSQWTRWKARHHEPHRTTWNRIVSATDELTARAREGEAA
jgi:hypothetical protein